MFNVNFVRSGVGVGDIDAAAPSTRDPVGDGRKEPNVCWAGFVGVGVSAGAGM